VLPVRSKSLGHPDEVFRFPGVVQNAVVLGDLMVAHSTVQPGWRWSIDMRPVVGGEWCQARHVGTILSGAFVFLFPDGARYELHAGDVYDMPPGHDGFTIGDGPCTVIEWAGVRAFGGFRAGLTGRHLVTLLLTDLVDSTSIATRLGDVAWHETLAAHGLEADVEEPRAEFGEGVQPREEIAGPSSMLPCGLDRLRFLLTFEVT
jgi:hypothetical protein